MVPEGLGTQHDRGMRFGPNSRRGQHGHRKQSWQGRSDCHKVLHKCFYTNRSNRFQTSRCTIPRHCLPYRKGRNRSVRNCPQETYRGNVSHHSNPGDSPLSGLHRMTNCKGQHSNSPDCAIWYRPTENGNRDCGFFHGQHIPTRPR